MITLTKFLEEAKRTIPQDKDVATKKKAAPKKYHVKLSKGTKQARAKHFEEHGQKADNDPSAYVPAPGDEKAKTKEKHVATFRRYTRNQYHHPGTVFPKFWPPGD